MTYATYERLAASGPSTLEPLNHPASADIEFEPERLKGGRIRAADLE